MTDQSQKGGGGVSHVELELRVGVCPPLGPPDSWLVVGHSVRKVAQANLQFLVKGRSLQASCTVFELSILFDEQKCGENRTG